MKGWDGGTAWINSSTLLERLNWATDVVWGNPDRGVLPFDPVAWLDGHGVKPDEAAGAFVNLLLQDDLATEARDLILAAGRDGSLARPAQGPPASAPLPGIPARLTNEREDRP